MVLRDRPDHEGAERARPRISSGELSWTDVLVPVTVMMPAKPVTKSIGTAAHAWRTVERPTRPMQATVAVASSSPTPGSGLARVPRASAPSNGQKQTLCARGASVRRIFIDD